MHFRRVLIVTAVIVFLCAVSLAVYNGLTSLKSSKDTSTEDHSLTDGDFIKREEVPVPGTNYQEENQPETGDAGQNEESQTDTAEKVQNAAEKTKPEKTQELKVLNNTLEYDFKAVLVGREGSGTFLKISHYLEGAGVEKEFGSDFIDELKHISITGSNEGTGGMDMSIGTVYLNPKQSKAYFILRENSAEDNMANVSLYSYNMIDGTIKKLFSDKGSFTDLFFTKDYKFAGFSYFDHPSTGSFEENSLLQVLRCETDDFIVKGSRNAEGALIGGNTDDQSLYDFVFLAWDSNTVAKLGLTVNPKTVPSSVGNAGKQVEVLYDVTKNAFVNREGNPISIAYVGSEKGNDGENQEGKGTGKTGDTDKETDTVKLLKQFYNYLLSDSDYSKAMNLLDETFRLRIAALSQLGITELAKSDINIEEATGYAGVYAGMLKLTSIEKIVSEVKENGLVKIYYLQSFAMDEENKIIQPLVAHLKKVDGSWKIVLIEDGDIDKEPFKN